MAPSGKHAVARLHKVYQDFFLIGAAVNPVTLEHEQELIQYHFNSLTAENEMKIPA